MNIYLVALGCKLNQAEIEALARAAAAAGLRVVARPEEADWALINTCAVTHIAARKSRQMIRQLRRANPALRLAVLGCYGEVAGEEARALAGVELVIPNLAKEEALARLLAATDQAPAPPLHLPPDAPLAGGHTRALVKIQDGCDHRCTYCVVSRARGPQRSVSPEAVQGEIAARLREGYQEIVLTGVNIGAYGRDSAPGAPLPPAQGWSLARLVGEILRTHPALPRLRLSSIEPWDVTPALLDCWADPRLCRHLHLPLQSGCDATLRRMGRRYRTDEFCCLAQALRARLPEVCLSTDVIVGFPGETEEEFAATRALCQELALARLHVFRYSPRPDTPAARMADPVAPPVAQARSEALIALGHDLARAFHARFVGAVVEVLFEQPQGHDAAGLPLWSGLTDNYVRVTVPHAGPLHNTLARVHCESADEEGLRGALLTIG
jgi:threonylcarbamoyladenosine tRNA methylthiotransferase MtaB